MKKVCCYNMFIILYIFVLDYIIVSFIYSAIIPYTEA